MKKLTWFRLYSEAVDDEKLRLLAFEDRWHFVALLCCKAQGLLDTSDPLMRRKVAVKLGLADPDLEDVIRRLAAVGLVDAETVEPSLCFVADPGSLRPAASVWRVIRDRIFKRDDYTCRYCGARGGLLECDHVVPVAKGGDHGDDNLATACRDCNRSKRDRLLGEWRPA